MVGGSTLYLVDASVLRTLHEWENGSGRCSSDGFVITSRADHNVEIRDSRAVTWLQGQGVAVTVLAFLSLMTCLLSLSNKLSLTT